MSTKSGRALAALRADPGSGGLERGSRIVDQMDETEGARVGRIPPPAYFAGALALGLLADRLIPLQLPGRRSRRVAGVLAIAAGGGLGVTAARSMSRQHTTIVPDQPVSTLLTTGVHAHSRNPIYTGLTAVYAGASLLTGSWWPLLGLPAVLGLVQRRVIDPEETYLARRFPAEYADYRARVRRWL